MYFKRDINRALMQLKGVGIAGVIPILIIYMLIPIVNYAVYSRYGFTDELYINIVQQTQLFYPLLSAWWIIVVFNEYIDGDGNELLYIYNKIKLKEGLIILIYYEILIFIPFFIYQIMYPELWFLFIKVAVVCMFYSMAGYFFLYLTKSAALSFVPILAYTFMSIVSYGSFDKISYYSLIVPTSEDIGEIIIPFLIMSLIFACLGVMLNKFTLKYN